MTSTTAPSPPRNDIAIFRRMVERQDALSKAAAEAILRLDFDDEDRKRMNELARKNRTSGLTRDEDDELESYLRVGQVLGVLQSKARRVLKKAPPREQK